MFEDVPSYKYCFNLRVSLLMRALFDFNVQYTVVFQMVEVRGYVKVQLLF